MNKDMWPVSSINDARRGIRCKKARQVRVQVTKPERGRGLTLKQNDGVC